MEIKNPGTTRLPIPNEYDDYVQRLADQLAKAKLVDIDARAAVMIAALNLLDEFMGKIRADIAEERQHRMQVLADLAEIRELD